MKKFLLSAMSLVAAMTINAQSLVMEVEGQEYKSGSSFNVVKEIAADDIPQMREGVLEFHLKNTSAQDASFKFKNAGDVLEKPEGYERQTQICTTSCFLGDDIPAFDIKAGGYLEDPYMGGKAACSTHIQNKEGILGTVKAQYEITNTADASDVYTFTVSYEFKAKGAICDVTTVNNMFVSQTGNGQVAFNYSFKSAQPRILSIINVTGQVVARYQIDNAEGTFDVPANLAKGMYIYSVEEAGKKVAAHKFVVK